MKLTKEQKYFLLTKFNILPDEVMDATLMRRSEWMKLIKNSEYEVAAGVDHCTKSTKHTIKSKSGHCVECKPETIAFQRKYYSSAEIYIMHSPSKKLVKVGIAASSEQRELSLNEVGYGNIKDWMLIYSIDVARAGEVEKKAHNILSEYHIPIKHFTGNSSFATEIFSCSINKAKNAIISIVS